MSSGSATRAPITGNSRLKSSPSRPAANSAELKKPALALVPAATPVPPMAFERGSKVPNETASACCVAVSNIGKLKSTRRLCIHHPHPLEITLGAQQMSAAMSAAIDPRPGDFRLIKREQEKWDS